MTTLRIRGLYGAALTSLFRQHHQDWEIVQPDDEVRACLPGDWPMDSPDVAIDEHADAQGVRDTLWLSGSGDGIERVLGVLQQHFTDIIIRRSGMQVGSMYLGLVGLVSRERRQSVVYLGGQLSGTLPMGPDDRGPEIGARIPVRIEALGDGPDKRPQLSAVLSVPGRYAVLSMTPAVRISKQITSAGARERLQQLGQAQETHGWGIIWRTAAQNAKDAVLSEEIQDLVQQAGDLRERLSGAKALGYLYGGDVSTQVEMPGDAKRLCDRLRAEFLPTLPGHHKYKAQGDVYGATVDGLEKELPAEVLRNRTAPLGVLASVNAMESPLRDTLRVRMRGLRENAAAQYEGQRGAYDLDAGWVEIRQELRNKDSYPAGLRLDKQPGDYTVTRLQEGSWHYVTRFYGRQGAWKADYVGIATPTAIFSDQLHLVDLGVSVCHSPDQPAELIGIESLQEQQKQGLVGAAMVSKVREEGAALLQQLRQEDLPGGE
jgi:hypothetical protein